MLCLGWLQNVNPQKWGFKKVKVQARGPKCNGRGTKHIAYVSTYNKTKNDTGWLCCLCLLLCTGVQNKTTNFWPRCQYFKILPRLPGSLQDHMYSANLFAASKIKLTLSNDGDVDGKTVGDAVWKGQRSTQGVSPRTGGGGVTIYRINYVSMYKTKSDMRKISWNIVFRL